MKTSSLLVLALVILTIVDASQAQDPWVHSFTPLRNIYVSPDGVATNKTIDYSGNGHEGTLSNVPVRVDGIVEAPEGESRALRLDGVDDYVSLSTGLAPWGTDASYMLWVRVRSSQDATLIGAFDGASSAGVGQDIYLNDGKAQFTVSENGNLGGCEDDTSSILGPDITGNQWHHVAVTIDQSANEAKLYVDGILQGSTDVSEVDDSGCAIPAVNKIGGGARHGAPRQYFNGDVDEARIYDRVLSAAEISAQYNNGQGHYGEPEANLLAGWHFDEPDAGSLQQPMTLGAALTVAEPGDLVWLLRGQYVGPVELERAGSAQHPIVYRAYPGHQATIVGNVRQAASYNWIWGLEVTYPDGTSGTGSGIEARASGFHVINCYLHHNFDSVGIGAWSTGPGQVYYGNIVHDVGKGNGTPSANWHGIYTQNTLETEGWKYFVNNVLIDNNANSAFNFHAYGECRDCEPILTGFHVEKNIVVNRRFLIGGFNKPVKNVVVKENYFYQVTPQFGYRRPTQVNFLDNYIGNGGILTWWFWGAGNGTSADFIKPLPNRYTGNTVINSGRDIQLRTSGYNPGRVEGVLPLDPQDAFDNNTYAGTFSAELQANGTAANVSSLGEWRTATASAGKGFDINSTVVDAPSEAKVVVLPNDYDDKRAHVAIFNWGLEQNVSVDLSGVVPRGAEFAVRPVKDAFGTPVVSGVYSAPITIPMNENEFAAFVVTVIPDSLAPAPPSDLRAQ